MAFLVPLALAGAGAAAGTASTIGLVTSIASAGIGALGAIRSADASSSAASYNAEVAANNATIAQQNATWAGQAGEQQAAMQEQKTRATVGAIQASQAAGGVDVNSGSAVDVRSSAAQLGELDAITIRSNAARQAYGYNVQAAGDTSQSQLDRFQASQDTTGGYINAGSTLLGGIGSATSQYSLFQSRNSGGPSTSFGGIS